MRGRPVNKSASRTTVLHSYQQLKEEPGVLIDVLSAHAGAYDHLKSQFFVKLLKEMRTQMPVTHC